ncbi:HAD family hydrolase [Methylacidiphilum caldifontis]|uniref:Phosphatase n=1 Tax=Methylacidiphilum caldifontis TaxID=2795386 RepID=A0A4Y8P731_9BACT|nr:HAD hydrolase-like protein [Methylacidiphilum caldifontis]QSR88836.1 HAD hydrolase-like protein [Methylacidiphilum caldifontis]TFE65905.1 phosphatase [Methylacidiphilum caldifontis]
MGRSLLKAIILDFDGTIGYTEKEAHLPACNEAFRKMNIPIQWSWEEFITLLELPGNQARMEYTYRKLYPFVEEKTLKELSEKWIKIKKELYVRKYVYQARLRDGISELIKGAMIQKIHVAIVSTSIEPQIEAFLDQHLPEARGYIYPILGKGAGKKTAEDSPLYNKCLEILNLKKEQAIAIEDSRVGLQAALKAGIKCVVVPNEYTAQQDFGGASFVTADISRLNLVQLEEFLIKS